MKKLLIIALSVYSSIGFSQAFKYPFQDPGRPREERVRDLIGRMTLDEKIAQLMNGAPAIERLGVPRYNWWNECLHGVARTRYPVTVFPQAIALAATWDLNTIGQMADICATEGRAIFNDSKKTGREGYGYHGLTFWTPNVNIFRDPRWGRGQETYGEDPFLTGEIGKAFVRHLETHENGYLKASACAKHYAVHSGPEPERHHFNAKASDYDLWDTYLPAFKDLVVDAQVTGVMCAYNAFFDKPCCGSDRLMQEILRDQWNFKGYVTSDCGGIYDFYAKHKTHPDAAAASADAVINGTDVECGTSYKALAEAVKKGLINEALLDVSLRRLFGLRFEMGMFDPDDQVPYSSISIKELDTPQNKEAALTAARQSIVLLKNDHLLPLSKKLRRVAVVGPNANDYVTPLGNYNGAPSSVSTPYEAIKAKLGSGCEVVYEQVSHWVAREYFEEIDTNGLFSFNGKKGFQAEYFNNSRHKGSPVTTRQETAIDYKWSDATAVTEGIPYAKNFSVRWNANFTPKESGKYYFDITAEDGIRLKINDKIVFDGLKYKNPKFVYENDFKVDQSYQFVIEYAQEKGSAEARIKMGRPAKLDPQAVARRYKGFDAVIYVGGISPRLEGESMRVNYDGFRGGDRTTIHLPSVQTETMKALHEAGIPVVFVMMTGSAIATPWESAHLPAIVNAWYGGQSAGTALADVLFGDYNPSGRLPVTFYKGDNDLPPFVDYSMDNRTYRYFSGQTLYPFGHGLSYTTFDYSNLTAQPTLIDGQKGYKVRVTVRNSGKREGDEVVQLYLQYGKTAYKAPLQALKGFERIALKAGESRTVEFSLAERHLTLVDSKGNNYPAPSPTVVVGGSSEGKGRISVNL